MHADVGCGQITWGRDVPEDDVLADIKAAGYAGAPLRVRRSAAETRVLYDRYGLRPAPGYFGGDFWDLSRQEEYVEAARQAAVVSRELGVSELYVAAGGFSTVTRSGRTRRDVAAHPGPADSLTDEEFAQFARCVEAIGRATLAEGVASCYHNHVGTFVETEAEIERLLAAVDPDVLLLGPDTGHLAWAGVDVVEFARRHAERIRTLHVKDVVADVRTRGVAAGWDYTTFQKHGIWTELGAGSVDFRGLLDVMDGAAFQGWLIVETDVTQQETPLASATISRRHLRDLGL